MQKIKKGQNSCSLPFVKDLFVKPVHLIKYRQYIYHSRFVPNSFKYVHVNKRYNQPVIDDYFISFFFLFSFSLVYLFSFFFLIKDPYLYRFVHSPSIRRYRCTCKIHLYYGKFHCCHTDDLQNTRPHLKSQGKEKLLTLTQQRNSYCHLQLTNTNSIDININNNNNKIIIQYS